MPIIDWYLVYAYALGSSFAVALLLTAVVRRFALRFHFLDHPGERKIHQEPIPLMGGVAIVGSFFFVMVANLLLVLLVGPLGPKWMDQQILYFLGEDHLIKLGGIFAGGLIIFALGLVDDLFALSPEKKLLGQILAGLVLVLCQIRLNLFLDNPWLSSIVTVAWVVFMANSLNLLDNMDGLCGGISFIAALALFLCALQSGETFLCVMLLVFAGSVGGFLFHNLNPARIFMGDAGAMFCGYFLATAAVLGTFYTSDMPSRISVAAPVLALSVPIFDTLSVIVIRWSKGESIMKGDKRHFSHRLVAMGMTRHQAVEFIFLVAGVNGLGAVLLPHVAWIGTILIVLQSVGVFSLIVLLMNTKRPDGAIDL